MCQNQTNSLHQACPEQFAERQMILSKTSKSNFVLPGQNSCQEWCRNWPTESVGFRISPEESLGDFLLAAMSPVEKGGVSGFLPGLKNLHANKR